MDQISSAPDIHALNIPLDNWTRLFWSEAAQGNLRFPRCLACGRFRWPPGPFCPSCRSQEVAWVAPGPARIYSFTIIPEGSEPPRFVVPALIVFSGIDHVRLLSAIVDAPLDAIRIGAELAAIWLPAADATVPMFRLA